MARFDHIGVLVNPERVDVADDVIERLRHADRTVTTARPDDPADLNAAVARLLDEGVDVVAAVGGDGTQRLVASRLVDSDTPLAVVPGGTVNLLGRVLGLGDADDSVRAIVGGETRTIDVGTLDDDVFVLNASTGWDATVIDTVDDRAKRFGRVGYTATGIRTWLRTTTGHVSVRLGGEPWFDGEALTVLVLNVGQRGSESLHIAPEARLDDGLLDVVVLRRKSILGLLRATVANLRRNTPPPDVVAIGQAASVRVEWSEPVAVQRDGDECEPAAATSYRCRPGALQIVVPGP